MAREFSEEISQESDKSVFRQVFFLSRQLEKPLLRDEKNMVSGIDGSEWRLTATEF